MSPILTVLNEFFTKAVSLHKKKTADYASLLNPFKNFEDSAILAQGLPEQGILFRLGDKMSRLSNLCFKEASVKDESFEDTALDAIVYICILVSYRRSKPRQMVEVAHPRISKSGRRLLSDVERKAETEELSTTTGLSGNPLDEKKEN